MSQFLKPRSARSIKATLSTILCTGLVLASVVVLNVGNTAAYAEDSTDTTTSAVDQTADSQSGTPTEQAPDPAPETPTPSVEAPAPSTPAPTAPVAKTAAKTSSTGNESNPGGTTKPCVATPFWSFSYDTATSSGTITVNGGDAGQAVCKPLYVRAASWKYTVTTGSGAPTWPQSLVGYNDYVINKIGTYAFTAPGIVCGQDDIYATFDYAGFAALTLPSVLTAAGTPFEPPFLSQTLPETGTPEGVVTHNHDPLTDCVQPGIAGIDVEKTASTATVAPGQVFNYTLAVTNSGTTAATGVVLTDNLDPSLKVAGPITAAGWTVTPTDPAALTAYGAHLTFTRTADGGTIGAGATSTITVPVMVNPSADPAITTIPNTAVVCATNVADCDEDLITLPLYDPRIAVDKTVAFASDNPNSQTDSADGTGTLVGEGLSKFVYTISASNPGLGAATGVTVVDTLPADLKISGTIIAPDWTWTITGGDANGFGATVHFTLKAASLAAGATAGPIQIPVQIRETTIASSQDNTATACITNLAQGQNCAEDDVLVKVKSIDLTTFTTVCESDVPWLYYDLTVNNVDPSLPVHFDWYGANGVLFDTFTLTNGVWTNSAGTVVPFVADGSPLKGKILWPAAAVNAQGVGIAFPGWRPAVEGETPTFENLILDPTLPSYQLRLPGSHITVRINPSVTAPITFPTAAAECSVPRNADLTLTKTAVADGTSVEITKTFPDSVFDYIIQVANNGIGAASNVTISDPIPADIRVDQVVTAGSPTFPRWEPCVVTGEDADGFGGTLNCTLIGMVAPTSSAPDIRLKVSVASDPAQIITNVATVKWTQDTDPGTILSTSDDARVTTDGSELPTLCVDCGALADTNSLAATGVDPALPITVSLLAVLAGIGLIVAASPKRRRRDR